MSQSRDVLELWRRLRQESLFVTNEREGLTRLHQELKGYARFYTFLSEISDRTHTVLLDRN